MDLEWLVAPSRDVQIIGLDRQLAERADRSVIVLKAHADREAFLSFISELGVPFISSSHVGLVRAHKSLHIAAGFKVAAFGRESFYAYRDRTELLKCVEEGWNSILRLFHVYPVDRPSENLVAGNRPQKAEVRRVLLEAPFFISCAADDDNMAHILPLCASLESTVKLLEDIAERSHANLIHVKSGWFTPHGDASTR
jgi:hypothetical protein